MNHSQAENWQQGLRKRDREQFKLVNKDTFDVLAAFSESPSSWWLVNCLVGFHYTLNLFSWPTTSKRGFTVLVFQTNPLKGSGEEGYLPFQAIMDGNELA